MINSCQISTGIYRTTAGFLYDKSQQKYTGHASNRSAHEKRKSQIGVAIRIELAGQGKRGIGGWIRIFLEVPGFAKNYLS
jgi:hypothetical protein